MKHQNNKKGNSDDPEIRPALRFASRENSETTQNGATLNKNDTNPGECFQTRGVKPTVSPRNT